MNFNCTFFFPDLMRFRNNQTTDRSSVKSRKCLKHLFEKYLLEIPLRAMRLLLWPRHIRITITITNIHDAFLCVFKFSVLETKTCWTQLCFDGNMLHFVTVYIGSAEITVSPPNGMVWTKETRKKTWSLGTHWNNTLFYIQVFCGLSSHWNGFAACKS